MTLPPLPTGHTIGCGIFNGQKLFTAEQMQAYGAACAAAERERIAAMFDAEHEQLQRPQTAAYYARAIRAQEKP